MSQPRSRDLIIPTLFDHFRFVVRCPAGYPQGTGHRTIKANFGVAPRTRWVWVSGRPRTPTIKQVINRIWYTKATLKRGWPMPEKRKESWNIRLQSRLRQQPLQSFHQSIHVVRAVVALD